MRNIISRRTYLAVGVWVALSGTPSSVAAGVNTWTAIGPDGGRVYDVEFSQSSPGTFYAVGRSGVYRSTVEGESFTLLREDLGKTPFDLAVDPARPDRVLVAAEGLQVGEGDTWTRTTTTVTDQGAKVATSRDGATVYFASSMGFFRSQDRGVTWQERAPVPPAASFVNSLQVDPTSSNVVYASVVGSGLFVSDDGGGAWQQLGASDPALIRTLNFVVDASNPQRLLAATNDHGLRISVDGGSSWNATTVTTGIWDVDVDPLDPRVIYVAGTDVRKSTDNGLTWTVLPVDQPPGSLQLTIDPTQPSRLAAFNGEGVSISTDSGATWAKRIAGFKGTEPTAFSSLPSSRRTYFGVNYRGGVYYVEDGEALTRSVNNDPLTLLAQQQGLISIHALALPGARDTLYAVLKGQILAKSIDAGLHWGPLAFPAPSVGYIAGSSLEPQTLYAAGAPGSLYKSIDGGASWAPSGAGLPDDFHVQSIAIASTPSTLYVVGSVSSTVPGSPPFVWNIYRSADAGATWAAASAPETRPISSVAVDPNDAQVVYAGFDSELRKTVDGGTTWTRFDRNGFPLCCSFRGVVFDPSNPRVFYALSTSVWRTVDAGASWEPIPAPTPTTFAAHGAIALDPSNSSRLLVGFTELGVRDFTIAPDLNLALTAPSAIRPNALATYTLRLRNLGPFHATGVRVVAQLPQGSTSASAVATGAACTVVTLAATCTFDVVPTAAAETTIAIAFAPPEGSVTVAASVMADQPDPVTANNVATSTLAANVASPASGGGGGGGATSSTALALLFALSMLKLWRTRRCVSTNSVR